MTIVITLALVGAVLSAFAIAMWIDRTLDTSGGDPVGSYLAFKVKHVNDYAFVWIGWSILSLLVIVGGGYTSRKDEFLGSAVQLVNAANYVLVVPALVAAYMLLLRSITRFPLKSVPADPKVPSRSWKGWRYGALIVVTLVILYGAIESERLVPSPSDPWLTCGVKPQRGDCIYAELSRQGMVFYLLRGLDTVMALGLICAIWLTFKRRWQRFNTRLIDNAFPGLGPTAEIRKVGGALVLVATLGSIVTLLHGAALYIQAKPNGVAYPLQDLVGLFLKSTWSAWLLGTIFASTVCGAIVFWLREQIRLVLAARQQDDESSIPKFGLATQNDEKTQFGLLKDRLDLEAKIAEKYAKVDSWPLPAGAVIAAGIGVISQIGNVLFAIMSFYAKSHGGG